MSDEDAEKIKKDEKMKKFIDAFNAADDDEEDENAESKDKQCSKSSCSLDKKDKSNVIEVDHDTFEDIIAANPNLLLSATAPWCGHC